MQYTISPKNEFVKGGVCVRDGHRLSLNPLGSNVHDTYKLTVGQRSQASIITSLKAFGMVDERLQVWFLVGVVHELQS